MAALFYEFKCNLHRFGLLDCVCAPVGGGGEWNLFDVLENDAEAHGQGVGLLLEKIVTPLSALQLTLHELKRPTYGREQVPLIILRSNAQRRNYAGGGGVHSRGEHIEPLLCVGHLHKLSTWTIPAIPDG